MIGCKLYLWTCDHCWEGVLLYVVSQDCLKQWGPTFLAGMLQGKPWTLPKCHSDFFPLPSLLPFFHLPALSSLPNLLLWFLLPAPSVPVPSMICWTPHTEAAHWWHAGCSLATPGLKHRDKNQFFSDLQENIICSKLSVMMTHRWREVKMISHYNKLLCIAW